MNTTPAVWLIPVDGSESSLNAVRHAVVEAKRLTPRPEIDLLNVQAPLSSDISRFIASETLRDFHQDAGAEALAEARHLLDRDGVAYRSQVLVGESAPTIAEFAREHGSTLIVMGARGLGTVIGALLGSVTVKVVHLSPVPVLLVK